MLTTTTIVCIALAVLSILPSGAIIGRLLCVLVAGVPLYYGIQARVASGQPVITEDVIQSVVADLKKDSVTLKAWGHMVIPESWMAYKGNGNTAAGVNAAINGGGITNGASSTSSTTPYGG